MKNFNLGCVLRKTSSTLPVMFLWTLIITVMMTWSCFHLKPLAELCFKSKRHSYDYHLKYRPTSHSSESVRILEFVTGCFLLINFIVSFVLTWITSPVDLSVYEQQSIIKDVTRSAKQKNTPDDLILHEKHTTIKDDPRSTKQVKMNNSNVPLFRDKYLEYKQYDSPRKHNETIIPIDDNNELPENSISSYEHQINCISLTWIAIKLFNCLSFTEIYALDEDTDEPALVNRNAVNRNAVNRNAVNHDAVNHDAVNHGAVNTSDDPLKENIDSLKNDTKINKVENISQDKLIDGILKINNEPSVNDKDQVDERNKINDTNRIIENHILHQCDTTYERDIKMVDRKMNENDNEKADGTMYKSEIETVDGSGKMDNTILSHTDTNTDRIYATYVGFDGHNNNNNNNNNNNTETIQNNQINNNHQSNDTQYSNKNNSMNQTKSTDDYHSLKQYYDYLAESNSVEFGVTFTDQSSEYKSADSESEFYEKSLNKRQLRIENNFSSSTVSLSDDNIPTIICTSPNSAQDLSEDGSLLLRKELNSQNINFHKYLDNSKLRFCQYCKIYKRSRVHHCSVCQKCIYQMDHHCAWIGNCIGWQNYKYFVLTILYGFLLSTFVSITLWESTRQVLKNKSVSFGVFTTILFSEAIAVALATASLIFSIFHLYLNSHGITTIEYWGYSSRIKNSRFDFNLVFLNLRKIYGPSVFLAFFPIDNREIPAGLISDAKAQDAHPINSQSTLIDHPNMFQPIKSRNEKMIEF